MRGVLLLAVLLPGALAEASPLLYEDTKERFRIALAEGWSLAPRFGDLYGMTFEKHLDGRETAVLTVHVDEVVANDLSSFAERAREVWAKDDERTKERRTAKIAGRPALIRDSEQKDRRIRSAFLEVQGRYFHLRLDAPKGLARTLEPDWNAAVAGFEARGKPGAVRAAPPPPRRSTGLEGTYERKKVQLSLEPGGRFRLGDQSGSWELEEDELVLSIPEKKPIRFSYALDTKAHTLTLHQPGMEAPAVYVRVEPEAADRPAHLEGRWEAEAAGRRTVLVLAASGSFEMGPLSGRWEQGPDRLTLFGGHGESVTYRYELGPGRLVLAGGDLDGPLTFRRSGGE
ncbi:MAG: hypothetical protein U1E65_30270 [Myxococcota bacterium]